MFCQKRKKSALSSDETVKSARPGHVDQLRARAFKMERMFETYPVLNKKNTFF